MPHHNATSTRVTRRTVELAGRWSSGVLRGAIQRAFASGKAVRFDGRQWRVESFVACTDGGVTWTATLVNEEPSL